MTTMDPKHFIKTVLIDELGQLIPTFPYISFVMMGIGIESYLIITCERKSTSSRLPDSLIHTINKKSHIQDTTPKFLSQYEKAY